jgi:hypothetical protein
LVKKTQGILGVKKLNAFYIFKVKYHRPIFANVGHFNGNHCLSIDSNPGCHKRRTWNKDVLYGGAHTDSEGAGTGPIMERTKAPMHIRTPHGAHRSAKVHADPLEGTRKPSNVRRPPRAHKEAPRRARTFFAVQEAPKRAWTP